MSNDPEEIRQQIEHTRSSLSYDVNALADEANPKNIAHRQADKALSGVRETATNLKERVMGTEDHAAQALSNTAGAISDSAGQAKQMAQQAPQQVRRQTRGNPLAAGVVAFGLGALIGSLIPSTEPERRAAEAVKDKTGPAMDQAKEMARDAVEQVKPAVQEAGEQLKQAATDAKDEVVGQAQQAKDHTVEQGKTAKDNLQSGTDGSGLTDTTTGYSGTTTGTTDTTTGYPGTTTGTTGTTGTTNGQRW